MTAGHKSAVMLERIRRHTPWFTNSQQQRSTLVRTGLNAITFEKTSNTLLLQSWRILVTSPLSSSTHRTDCLSYVRLYRRSRPLSRNTCSIGIQHVRSLASRLVTKATNSNLCQIQEYSLLTISVPQLCDVQDCLTWDATLILSPVYCWRNNSNLKPLQALPKSMLFSFLLRKEYAVLISTQPMSGRTQWPTRLPC